MAPTRRLSFKIQTPQMLFIICHQQSFRANKTQHSFAFFSGLGTRFYAFLKREWLSHFNCALLPTASRGGVCLHRPQCLCFVSLCSLLPERCRYTVWNEQQCDTKARFHWASLPNGNKGCFLFSELKTIYLTWLSRKVIQRQNDFLAQRRPEFSNGSAKAVSLFMISERTRTLHHGLMS